MRPVAVIRDRSQEGFSPWDRSHIHGIGTKSDFFRFLNIFKIKCNVWSSEISQRVMFCSILTFVIHFAYETLIRWFLCFQEIVEKRILHPQRANNTFDCECTSCWKCFAYYLFSVLVCMLDLAVLRHSDYSNLEHPYSNHLMTYGIWTSENIWILYKSE